MAIQNFSNILKLHPLNYLKIFITYYKLNTLKSAQNKKRPASKTSSGRERERQRGYLLTSRLLQKDSSFRKGYHTGRAASYFTW